MCAMEVHVAGKRENSSHDMRVHFKLRAMNYE